jgi:hypothetical protein
MQADGVIGKYAIGGILEGFMSKPKMRARLAALSFTEKVRILERLRDRSLGFAAAGLRRKTAKDGKDSSLQQGNG